MLFIWYCKVNNILYLHHIQLQSNHGQFSIRTFLCWLIFTPQTKLCSIAGSDNSPFMCLHTPDKSQFEHCRVGQFSVHVLAHPRQISVGSIAGSDNSPFMCLHTPDKSPLVALQGQSYWYI